MLGESYRSNEHAIKELIDNAWDAEATKVYVTLPEILSPDLVIVADNGSGMKTAELESEYLNIANPRLSRKGAETPHLKRVVKGRKGIGKSAGLILAAKMRLETRAHGTATRVEIEKARLLAAKGDLEKVPLPIEAIPCANDEHGTTVSLSELSATLSFPKPDKLKELLAFDYGRETDFAIFVNGDRVFHAAIQGQSFTLEVTLPNGLIAAVSYTVSRTARWTCRASRRQIRRSSSPLRARSFGRAFRPSQAPHCR